MSERGVVEINITGDEGGDGEMGKVVDYRQGDQGGGQKKPEYDDRGKRPGLQIEETPARREEETPPPPPPRKEDMPWGKKKAPVEKSPN
ncbi:hypothetical protein KJ903_04340 [Patescibacteria group bacterium]|nr:hypothetical protein [Patescibacteria group bacterium]